MLGAKLVAFRSCGTFLSIIARPLERSGTRTFRLHDEVPGGAGGRRTRGRSVATGTSKIARPVPLSAPAATAPVVACVVAVRQGVHQALERTVATQARQNGQECGHQGPTEAALLALATGAGVDDGVVIVVGMEETVVKDGLNAAEAAAYANGLVCAARALASGGSDPLSRESAGPSAAVAPTLFAPGTHQAFFAGG